MEKKEIVEFVRVFASQKAIVQFSEADLAYLLDETDVKIIEYLIDNSKEQRSSFIINELIKQCEYIVDGYSRFILLIHSNPACPLMMEEMNCIYQSLQEDVLFQKRVQWGFVEDESVASIKVTFIMSRKAVMTVKELVDRHEFSELLKPLSKLCDFNWLVSLQESYGKLRQLIPQPTCEILRIVSRWEGMSPLIDCNSSVWNEEENNMMPLSLYQSLEKLLSMPIYVDEGVQLEEVELLAGILCDVTYLKMKQKDQ